MGVNKSYKSKIFTYTYLYVLGMLNLKHMPICSRIKSETEAEKKRLEV